MQDTDEISNLKPGRDLDIKVALTVMGYVWLKHLLQFSAELAVKWLGTATAIEESGGVYTLVTESQFVALKERENFAEDVLAFSTEIEAAEQVIVRMTALGYRHNVESTTTPEGEYYNACFYRLGSEQAAEAKVVCCKTKPEAIVKAALLAM